MGLSLVEPADGSAPAKRRDSLIIREQSRSPTPLIGKGEKGLGGSRDSVYESEYDRLGFYDYHDYRVNDECLQ